MHKTNILWVDNDPAFVLPFAIALNEVEFEVSIARTVTEAEVQLRAGGVDAIILDVMIPVTEDEVRSGYSPDETDESHKTGLVFYKRVRSFLKEHDIPILVLTVRVDQSIMNEFAAAGVAAGSLATKMDLREADVLLARVRKMMKTQGEA